MNWKIDVLNYGKLEFLKELFTSNIDVGLKIWGPYLGFLLRNGNRNILVDTGIHDRFIVDGKAWGGLRAEGGEKFVVDALKKANVQPKDIDLVIYTHLHNDHCANCHLFPNSKHVIQKVEWLQLLEPLPHEKVRQDYDQQVIPELRKLNTLFVEGNFQLAPGIMVYHTPGHTSGSMSLTVETSKGLYCIVGDTALFKCNMFPQMSEITQMDGSKIKITPQPEPAIPALLVSSYFDWLKSIYLLKTLCVSEEFALTGHDPSNFDKIFP